MWAQLTPAPFLKVARATVSIIMSSTEINIYSSVEHTTRLFEMATSAGHDAMRAHDNMYEKARAFFFASYAAVHAAQSLKGADYNDALDRLFGRNKPKDKFDAKTWFKAVAPRDFLLFDKYKSARSKYTRALRNALEAGLTPDQVSVELSNGGIDKLSREVPKRSRTEAAERTASSESSGLIDDADSGPSPQQEREMDAEQDRSEELEERAREAEEASQYRKAYARVSAALHHPDRASVPISDGKSSQRLNVTATEIADAIKRAEGAVYCLAVLRVDPVREGRKVIGAEVDDSTIELVTADPRRIKMVLTDRFLEGPDEMGRTIEHIVRVVREGSIRKRGAGPSQDRPSL